MNPILQLAPGQLLQWAMLQFYAFTLVLVRISGLMIIGPVFGQPIFPTNIRILLIVSLSLLITPTLHDQTTVGFYQLISTRISGSARMRFRNIFRTGLMI